MPTDATGALLKSSWAGSGDALKRKYGTMVVKKFLEPLVSRVGILPFCWNQDWPKGTGDTMIFRRIATDTTIMPELGDGENSADSDRFISTIEAELKEFGKSHKITKKVKRTGIGPLMEDLSRQVGFEVARDIDDYIYRTMSPLADFSFPRLDSLAGNHQFFATTSDGTTTTIISTELTQADDYWNNGTVCPMEGRNGGAPAHAVSDFANATGTITITTAYEYACLTGTRCVVGRNVGKTVNNADEVITSGAISEVMVRFMENGALGFDGEGLDEYLNVKEDPMQGHFFAGHSPAVYDDLFEDPKYTAVATQGDAWKPSWSNYQVKRWKGFAHFNLPRQFRTDNPATSGTDEATTFQSNGPVHVSSFLSKWAMSASKLTGEGKGKAGIIIRYLQPGSQTTSQPQHAFDVLSAEINFARAVTSGPWGFNYGFSARR